MSRFQGHNIFFFHYIDDILLLARDRGILRVVTGLCEFLHIKLLLISSKSQTEPSATVTWIGETFDLS